MAIAAVLFITYILSLVFSLITHKELFAGESGGKGECGEEKDTAWSVSKAITILALATTLVAFMDGWIRGGIWVAIVLVLLVAGLVAWIVKQRRQVN